MKLGKFIGLTLAASISTLSIPNLAQAQTSIEQLQRVNTQSISGTVRSVVGNNFTLEDGSGQIIVDAGPRWWREVNVSPGEKVTVAGELGRGGEFDAFSITKADGSVIEIRPAEPGPPPWAGGPNRAERSQQQNR